ncbi:TPA: hypothetical protein JAN03_24470 [Citrobacter freundii]|nr:hypothetical protein [Citrobacter freundii]
MKNLIIVVLLMAVCIFSLFIVGSIFYLLLETFMYFYLNTPISFEFFQFSRLLKMSVYGGGFLGLGIGLLHIMKVKGF